MNARDPKPRAPERLLHDPELGRLIARANASYRAGLDEPAAFQRLSEQLEIRPQSWRWQAVTFGALASIAAGLVLMIEVSDDMPHRVTLSPEVPMGRRAALLREAHGVEHERHDAPAAAVRTRELEPSPATELAREAIDPTDAPQAAARTVASPRERERESPSDETPHSEPQQARERPAEPSSLEKRDRSEVEPETQHQLVGVPHGNEVLDRERDGPARKAGAPDDPEREKDARATHAPTSASREIEARLDCPELLRKDARAAERCYAERATSSSGLSAEAALYELARLRRDVQRDASGALAALDDYRERFPRGSLRNEVALSRVELLSELGRSREALTEAAALIASAQGRERAAELHVLRGNIFRRDLDNPKLAVIEYAKAEAFGGTFGAEATRLRGLSLESLGDLDGALAAYRRYLSGPEQARRGEVDRRVEALTAARSRAAAP